MGALLAAIKAWKYLKPTLYGLAAVAIVLFMLWLNHLMNEAAKVKVLEEANASMQAQAVLHSEALLQYGKDLAAEKAKANKLKGDLDAEIKSNRVYDDCLLPANGLRIYNEALKPASR